MRTEHRIATALESIANSLSILAKDTKANKELKSDELIKLNDIEKAIDEVLQEYIKAEGVPPQKLLLVAEGDSQLLSAKQTVSISVAEIFSYL